MDWLKQLMHSPIAWAVLSVLTMYDEEKQVLGVTLEERRRARVFKVAFD